MLLANRFSFFCCLLFQNGQIFRMEWFRLVSDVGGLGVLQGAVNGKRRRPFRYLALSLGGFWTIIIIRTKIKCLSFSDFGPRSYFGRQICGHHQVSSKVKQLSSHTLELGRGGAGLRGSPVPPPGAQSPLCSGRSGVGRYCTGPAAGWRCRTGLALAPRAGSALGQLRVGSSLKGVAILP